MNNKKILIVDNELDNTSVFSLALEAEGFKALPKSILQKIQKVRGRYAKDLLSFVEPLGIIIADLRQGHSFVKRAEWLSEKKYSHFC